jgi:hypothetical protein
VPSVFALGAACLVPPQGWFAHVLASIRTLLWRFLGATTQDAYRCRVGLGAPTRPPSPRSVLATVQRERHLVHPGAGDDACLPCQKLVFDRSPAHLGDRQIGLDDRPQVARPDYGAMPAQVGTIPISCIESTYFARPTLRLIRSDRWPGPFGSSSVRCHSIDLMRL